MPIVKSLREVAEHFGRSERTVDKWVREAKKAKSTVFDTKGDYDTDKIELWRKGRAVQVDRESNDRSEREYNTRSRHEKLRSLELKNRAFEAKLDRESASLWPKDVCLALFRLLPIELQAVIRRLQKDGNHAAISLIENAIERSKRRADEIVAAADRSSR